MKIKDFLNSENQKIDHLSGNDKAEALLKSVINELTTDIPEYSMTRTDYQLELFVMMQFLEYYIDSGNFNLIAMPYPVTKEEKERNNEIKSDLQKVLIQ